MREVRKLREKEKWKENKLNIVCGTKKGFGKLKRN